MTIPIPAIPWYRQFWPWFIIAFPATAVIAGLATVYIAFDNADALVKDNYYRDGLAINRELARDRRAALLAISAEVRIDVVTGEVMVALENQESPPGSLELSLIHPVDEVRDQALGLHRVGPLAYRGELEMTPRGRYYLRLQSGEGEPWRLNGEINLDQRRRLVLTPDV